MNEVLEVLLRRHRPDNEALSALLDGQLDGRKLDAVQSHVASCEPCRERLAALRRTRDALRAMPAVDAPRSFRLRAADVAAPAPVRRAPVAMRAMPMLGAAAALVFIVVLEADLSRGGSSSTFSSGTGLQAMAAPSRSAETAPSGAVGEIAADSGAATTDNAPRSSSNPTEPPANGFDSSGGAGSPPAPAGAPATPEAGGSPQPALGLAPEQATPTGAQAAPNVPVPAAPPTQNAPSSQPKSAATQPVPTPADARQAYSAPTASNGKSASAQTSSSSDRSDVAYRIVEVVAAATALAAIAAAVGWRIGNRQVGP